MDDPVSASVLLWATAGLLLGLATLGSVLSAMLERSGPVRLRHWAEEADGRLRKLYESPLAFDTFRYLLSVAAKAAPVALAVLLASLLARLDVASPLLWVIAGVLLLIVLVELVNRVLVARSAEEVLRSLTPIYRALVTAATPLIPLVRPLLPLEPPEGREEEEDDEASDEEIEEFIALGTREGILEPAEGELLWGIVDFGDTQVKSVMTPRIDVFGAPLEAGFEELAELFLESGHSRLPLYDGSIDRIVGILHIRDVLKAVRSPGEARPRELTTPPLFVPETKPLDELLAEMQEHRRQMAVVVDEYGGTAGVVTVEDLLEEIVGEILDEHEDEPAEIESLEDGAWRLDGRAHVEHLEELFGVDVDGAPYETVGGLVLSVLGDVPQAGDTLTWHGLRLTVGEVAERRVQSVRVERLPPEEAAPA